MPQNLSEFYEQEVRSGRLQRDPEQMRAIDALLNLQKTLLAFKPMPLLGKIFKSKKKAQQQGVYMYGGVGRGKSMLMDAFFNHVPIQRKNRVHFNEFMISTHEYMHMTRGDGADVKGVDDILPYYAKKIAKDIQLLCFDEFQVTDVADAMILSRLFRCLFEENVFIVCTSNKAPDELYKGGLQYERFAPFIPFMEDHMHIVHLDSPHDYRKKILIENPLYFYPLSAATERKVEALFKRLSNGFAPTVTTIEVKSRRFTLVTNGEGVARTSFNELCEKPLGAEDYIAIAKRFHTVFIENIPSMKYDRRNEAKRFILLIDALYDAGIKVVFSAETEADKLYYGSDHGFEFQRTLSRIHEMQSKEYIQKGQ